MCIDYTLLNKSFRENFTDGKLAEKYNKDDNGKHPASEIYKKAVAEAYQEMVKDGANSETLVSFFVDVKQSSSIQLGNTLETFINKILDKCERKEGSSIKNLQSTLDNGRIKTKDGSKQIDAIWFDYKDNTLHYREVKSTTNYDTEKDPEIKKKVKLVKEHLARFDITEDISVSKEVDVGGLTPIFYEDPDHKNKNGFYSGLKSFLEEVRIKNDFNIENLKESLKEILKEYLIKEYKNVK